MLPARQSANFPVYLKADTDDGSIIGGKVVQVTIALGYVWDATAGNWVRETQS